MKTNKETVEEAAERLAKDHCSKRVNTNTTEFQVQQLILKGAKWQAERMYSEEEVIRLLQKYRFDLSSGTTPIIGDTVPGWFEQFKKKV